MASPVPTGVIVFVAAVLFACAPLLGIGRIRALFRWPTRWLVVNYAIAAVGILLVQVLSYFVVILIVAGTGSVSGGEAAGVVGGILAVNVLVPGAAAVAALRVLPARGYWTPDGGGLGGRLALVVGVLWYAVATSIVFLLVSLVFLIVNLPT